MSHGEDHGSRPDGDSVWFEPDDPLLLNDLGGVDAKLNGGGCAQLRLEAIDALELHHAGAHHRRPECERARSFLVERLGFRSLFAPGDGVPSLVRVARPDAPRGFIATRGCDSPRSDGRWPLRSSAGAAAVTRTARASTQTT